MGGISDNLSSFASSYMTGIASSPGASDAGFDPDIPDGGANPDPSSFGLDLGSDTSSLPIGGQSTLSLDSLLDTGSDLAASPFDSTMAAVPPAVIQGQDVMPPAAPPGQDAVRPDFIQGVTVGDGTGAAIDTPGNTAAPSADSASAGDSSAPQTYTVAPGDSLSSIASRLYGDANRWPEIYQANQDAIGDQPNALQAGTELQVPSEGVDVDPATRNSLIRAAHIDPSTDETGGISDGLVQHLTTEPTRPSDGTDSVTGSLANVPSAQQIQATMRDSSAGKPEAIVQNLQNIVNATQDRFKADFVKQYQSENDGQMPSDDVVKAEYYDQLMKGFVNARYEPFVKQDNAQYLGMDGLPLAGFDPKNLNPVFNDDQVKQMYQSFPGKYVPPAGDQSPISINHLLSGIQWQTTSSDSLFAAAVKNTAGVAVNSNFAEDVLKPREDQEIGQGGIYAAKSPQLQSAFQQDPVGAMRQFLANPQTYVTDGKTTTQYNPVEGLQLLGHAAASLLR